MLRKMFAMFVGAAALALFVGSGVVAEDKKEEKKKTLEGSLVCTKCELKETKACGHALIVKEKDKDGKEVEVKYYINDKGGKETYHKEVCSAPADAKVTGKVSEKKEKDVVKKYIDDAKVEIKK